MRKCKTFFKGVAIIATCMMVALASTSCSGVGDVGIGVDSSSSSGTETTTGSETGTGTGSGTSTEDSGTVSGEGSGAETSESSEGGSSTSGEETGTTPEDSGSGTGDEGGSTTPETPEIKEVTIIFKLEDTDFGGMQWKLEGDTDYRSGFGFAVKGKTGDSLKSSPIYNMFDTSVIVDKSPFTEIEAYGYSNYIFDKWSTPIPETFPDTDMTITALFKPAPELTKAPNVGDIIMKDGSVKASSTFTSADKADAIAVVYKVDATKNTAYALGLKPEKNKWADTSRSKDASANAASTMQEISALVTNVTNLSSYEVTQGNSGRGDTFYFDGYLDGSEGLAKLKSAVGSGYTAENYPAWYWAENYGNTNCAGTKFTAGWYIPSVAELFDVWKADRALVISGSLRVCGASTMTNQFIWSSSQTANSDSYYAERIGFNDNTAFIAGWHKGYSELVYVVRKFTW